MQTWPQDGDQPTPFENFAVEHVPKCQSVDRLVHFEVGSFGLMGAWSCQQIGRRQEQWPETNHTVKCRCVDSLYFSDDMWFCDSPSLHVHMCRGCSHSH
jgi:hypothetical protein